jgi:hypothetical protein
MGKLPSVAFVVSLLACWLVLVVAVHAQPPADPAGGASPTPSKTSAAPASSGSRGNLELVFLGTLIGLVFKTTLDTIFKEDVDTLASPEKTKAISWASVLMLFRRHRVLLFPVFLLTLVRFAYGSYRLHEVFPHNPPLLVFLIDAAGLLGDFFLFYLAGLGITRTALFFRMFVIVHLWDLAWFGLLNIGLCLTGSAVDQNVQSVTYSFLVFDLITVVALCLIVRFLGGRPGMLEIAGAIFLLVIGCFDLWYNYPFYFSAAWPQVAAS